LTQRKTGKPAARHTGAAPDAVGRKKAAHVYESILVAVDGSNAAERALTEAIALARGLGSTLRLLHVADARVPDESLVYAPPAQLAEDFRVDTEAVLPRAVERALAGGVKAEGIVRRDTNRRVAEQILDEASRARSGLIVMGTHGRTGLARVALGSDAESVLREAPVPVLLVRTAAATGLG
jgi:nucleotide-binding universal stress UspA family protein